MKAPLHGRRRASGGRSGRARAHRVYVSRGFRSVGGVEGRPDIFSRWAAWQAPVNASKSARRPFLLSQAPPQGKDAPFQKPSGPPGVIGCVGGDIWRTAPQFNSAKSSKKVSAAAHCAWRPRPIGDGAAETTTPLQDEQGLSAMGVHLRRAAGRRGGSVTQCMADKLRGAALSRLRRLEASSTNVKAAFDFARFLSARALRSAASSISGCAESAAGEGRTRFFVDMGRANVGRHVG